MTGTFAQITNVILMAIAAVVALSMVVGAVDLLRHPGWAWKTAGEPKAICLLLVLLLPGVGLATYAFGARPKVIAIVATGRAASLPFERFADREAIVAEDTRLIQALALPTSIGSFGEPRVDRPTNDDGDTEAVAGDESPDANLTTAAAATTPNTKGLHFPGGTGRPYHPRQRVSFEESESLAAVAAQILGATQEMTDQVHSGRRVHAIHTIDAIDAIDSNDEQPGPRAAVASTFTRSADTADLRRESGTNSAPMSSGQSISKTHRSGGPAIGLPLMIPMQVALNPTGINPTTADDIARGHGDLLVSMGRDDPIAAQWMDDPIGRHQYRYWDGNAWTKSVSDNGIESQDPAHN